MSEQIQFLLNEMENKFEESFSESNHEEPVNKELNPESGKKDPTKPDNHKNNQVLGDFDQMKDLVLQELNQEASHHHQDNIIQLENHQFHDQESNQQLPTKSANSKRLNTPNFKFKEQHNDDDLQKLRKASSQQHFNNTISYQSEENGENPFYYKQLTMKLEKALMKISSDKVIGPSKKSYGFYDRVQQFQQKKQRQIQRRKHQLQEKQINSIQDRPLINSHSRALVAQFSNDPIHIRADKIIEKRKQKEQEYKKIKQKRQQKEYEAYKEEFEGYMSEIKQKYQGKTLRSPEEYYHEQLIWIKAKEKNIQSRLTQQKEKINEQITFKPLINSKSQKIINKKKDQKRVPIFDREPKQKEQIKDPNCTFKPKINKNNFYKKASYYQAPF